jgi:antitoxin YefM
MSSETTYASLRANLAGVLDRVAEDREVVVVHRKRGPDVALIAAEELASLMETAHLLRSPANARRLMAASRRAERGNGTVMSVDQLRRSVGLGRAKR